MKETILSEKLLRFLSLAAILALALAVLLPANPAWMQGVNRDSGVFLYVGWRILDGEVPYRDVWDHKPPGIFYLDALGLALADGSRWGVWAIEALLLGVAAWLGWRLLRQVFGAWAAFFASVLWLGALISLLEGGNLTTEYTLPLQFACLGLFYQAEGQGRYGWRAFVTGALCGIAFLFKPNTIGVGLAIGLYWLFGLRNRQQRTAILGNMLLLLGGAALPVALTALYLGLAGALPAFWDAVLQYNAVYSSQPLFEHVNAVLKGIGALNHSGLFLLAVIGWLAAAVSVRYRAQEMHPAHKALLYVALLNLPVELLLASISGYGHRHYFMPLLPACALLSAQAHQVILDYFQRPGLPRWAAGLVTVSLLAVAGAAQSVTYYLQWQSFRQVYPAQVVSYITQHTAPDESVLVWGSQPGINYLAQRRSPSRYIYQFPLLLPGYTTPQMIEAFLDELMAAPPRLVVCSPGNDFDARIFPVRTDKIEAGLEWFAAHYAAKLVVSDWTVYEFAP